MSITRGAQLIVECLGMQMQKRRVHILTTSFYLRVVDGYQKILLLYLSDNIRTTSW